MTTCKAIDGKSIVAHSGVLNLIESTIFHRKYSEIVESNKRWYLFRDVAVEFLFADKRNFLCVLKNKKERQAVLQRINGKIDPNAIKQSALGSFLLDTMQKAIDKAGTEIDDATHRWQQREISNVC